MEVADKVVKQQTQHRRLGPLGNKNADINALPVAVAGRYKPHRKEVIILALLGIELPRAGPLGPHNQLIILLYFISSQDWKVTEQGYEYDKYS